MKRKDPPSSDPPASKKQKIGDAESAPTTSNNAVVTEEDLPLEIIGNQIFKFFQFHYWLKNLVLVNKRWKQAAIHSNAQKQLILIYSQQCDGNAIATAARYQITELFIYSNYTIQSADLELLLLASKKLVVFASLSRAYFGEFRADLTFPNITTVAVPDHLRKHFPNATRVELLSNSKKLEHLPKVTELVMYKRKRLSNSAYKAILTRTPNVKTVYIFHKLEDLNELQLEFPNVTFVTSIQPYHQRAFNVIKQATPLYDSTYNWDDQSMFMEELKFTSLEYEVDLFSRIREYSFPYFEKASITVEAYKTRSEVVDHYVHYASRCPQIPLSQLYKTFFSPLEMLQVLLQAPDTKRREEFLLDNISSLQQSVNPKYLLVVALYILSEEQVMQLYSEEALRTIINNNPSYPSILTYYEEYPREVRLLAPLIDDWSDDTIVDSAISNGDLDDAVMFIQNGAKVHIDRLFDKPGLLVQIDEFDEEPNYERWKAFLELIVVKGASPVPIKYWLFESNWYEVPTPRSALIFLEALIALGADIHAQQRLPEEFKGGSLYNWLIYKKVDFSILEHLSWVHKVNPGQIDGRGQTALSMAMLHATSRIRFLINRHGHQLNLQNGFVCAMAIHRKSDQKYVDMIDCFVNNRADINALGRSFHSTVARTPLTEALHRNLSLTIIKYLLEKDARTDVVTSEGDAALHVAIKSHRDSAVIDALCNQGADVNRVERHSLTPLMLATQYCEDSLVLCLLEHGADVTRRDVEGTTFFHHLLARPADLGEAAIVDIILAKYNKFFIDEAKAVIQLAITKQDPILLSIIYSKFMSFIDLTKILIEEIGVDVNTRCSATGRSLLALAAKFEVVEYLIAQGINVNMQDKYGESALMLVVKDKVRCHEKERFVKLLLDNGADVHLKNHNGISPIDIEPHLPRSNILRL